MDSAVLRWSTLVAAVLAGCAGGWDTEVHELWPSLVSVTRPRTGPDADVKALRRSLLTLAAEEPSVNKSNRGGWQSSMPNLLFSLPGEEVVHVRTKVHAALEGHLRTLREPGTLQPLGGKALVRIVHSWANVNAWADWNSPHVHPGCDLSGAFYLSCPGSEPCTLVLEDPRGASRGSLDAKTEQVLRLEEGSAVVFPGWLKHYVPPDARGRHSERRVTLSFNARVRLQPGRPPLDIYFDRGEVADAKVGAVEPMSLWPTLVTTVYPSAQQPAHLEALAVRDALHSRNAQFRSLLDPSIPGVAAAREQVEVALEAHLREHAKALGFQTGVVTVRIQTSWASAGRSLPLRNPHGHAGSDLSVVLCVGSPEDSPYVLELEDPREAAGGVSDMPLGIALGTGIPGFLRLWTSGALVFPSRTPHAAEPKGEATSSPWLLFSYGARVDWQPGLRPLVVRFEAVPVPGVDTEL